MPSRSSPPRSRAPRWPPARQRTAPQARSCRSARLPGMLAPGVAVVSEPRRVALLAAELMANRLRARPGLRVLLPTGHTPRGMYAALRAHAADGSLPTAQATAFQLDEYLGLGADDPRSFRATLDREIAGIGFGTCHALDGTAGD